MSRRAEFCNAFSAIFLSATTCRRCCKIARVMAGFAADCRWGFATLSWRDLRVQFCALDAAFCSSGRHLPGDPQEPLNTAAGFEFWQWTVLDFGNVLFALKSDEALVVDGDLHVVYL